MELNKKVQKMILKCLNVDKKITVIQIRPRYLFLVVFSPTRVQIIPISNISVKTPRIVQMKKLSLNYVGILIS